VEASALRHHSHAPALRGRSPLLRLQSDERLIALTRRGQHAAFEALVQRYQSRLLAFCRHMLGSTEDAEDVLQEVFTSAFNAIRADERYINARPWLYRIARNRCLNHLRRPVPAGQDSMDVFERDGGTTTADTVHKREEFRDIVTDVQALPETQRTALLLREMDALSYEQIALAMDTTVPSVKSLLVRARVSLAEAGEARLLTCDEVRQELGEVAEGLRRTSAPVRRHLKTCERCKRFRVELNRANRALAAVYPIGPAILLHKLLIMKIGLGAAGGGSAAAGGSGLAGGAGAGGAVTAAGAGTAAAGAGSAAAVGSFAAAGGGGAAAGALSAGVGTLAGKAAAGLAAAAIVTAGAVEVERVQHDRAVAGATPAVVQTPAPKAQAAVAAPGEEEDAEAKEREREELAAEEAAVRTEAEEEAGAVEQPATEAGSVPAPGEEAVPGAGAATDPGLAGGAPAQAPAPEPRVDPDTGGVSAPEPDPPAAEETEPSPGPAPSPATAPGEPAPAPVEVPAAPAVAGEPATRVR
jgi:RNA polymerase sigma factor (sigma-70 family)